MQNKKTRRRSTRYSREDMVLYVVTYTIVITFTLAVLFPIIYIISASFSDSSEVMRGRVFLFPVKPTLEGYRAIFSNNSILTGFRNTVIYTVLGTAVNVSMTLICAYPLARKELPFRRIFTIFFIFTMFFSGGLIPSFLLINSLGMMDTIWAIILPGTMSVYNMLIVRTFFVSSIPYELMEASKIDGCSDIRYFFSILLPLSPAVIAVITLFYAVGHWNSYFSALIYLRDKNKQPLQLIVRNILLASRLSLSEFEDPELAAGKIGLEYLVKYALIVVSSTPIIILYPFIQKYFTKGVMLGSVKG